jgi:hypothetical protein
MKFIHQHGVENTYPGEKRQKKYRCLRTFVVNCHSVETCKHLQNTPHLETFTGYIPDFLGEGEMLVSKGLTQSPIYVILQFDRTYDFLFAPRHPTEKEVLPMDYSCINTDAVATLLVSVR